MARLLPLDSCRASSERSHHARLHRTDPATAVPPAAVSLFLRATRRGVRLRGKDRSLKRSSALEAGAAPKPLRLLETLNIFGVRANSMQRFREELQKEGIETDLEVVEVLIRRQEAFLERGLHGLRLRLCARPEAIARLQRIREVFALPTQATAFRQRGPGALSSYPFQPARARFCDGSVPVRPEPRRTALFSGALRPKTVSGTRFSARALVAGLSPRLGSPRPAILSRLSADLGLRPNASSTLPCGSA